MSNGLEHDRLVVVLHSTMHTPQRQPRVMLCCKLPTPPHLLLLLPVARHAALSCRVEDCFVKDEYALVSEEECGTPFLHEGVVPEVGMKLYMQVRQTASDPVLRPVPSQLSKC